MGQILEPARHTILITLRQAIKAANGTMQDVIASSTMEGDVVVAERLFQDALVIEKDLDHLLRIHAQVNSGGDSWKYAWNTVEQNLCNRYSTKRR